MPTETKAFESFAIMDVDDGGFARMTGIPKFDVALAKAQEIRAKTDAGALEIHRITTTQIATRAVVARIAAGQAEHTTPKGEPGDDHPLQLLRASRFWLETLCETLDIDPAETTVKASTESVGEIFRISLADHLRSIDALVPPADAPTERSDA